MNKLGSELAKSIREIAVLVKSGGEGSRGGKVIGHTKNGYPIYDAEHSSYSSTHIIHAGAKEGMSIKELASGVRSSLPHYSQQDHENAYDVHKRILHYDSPKVQGPRLSRAKRQKVRNAMNAHFAAMMSRNS